MSADGTDTAVAPAATGSTILTSGIPAPAAPPPGSAAAAVEAVIDGPPEWAPQKFWDPDKKSVRVEDLGKGYKNLEQLLGRDKVPVPASDEDEEGWQRWYAASGRPEAPDKYELQRPDRLPEGMEYDEDTEKEFRSWAHNNGLNKRQAKALYDGFVKRQIDRQAAWHTHQQQARATVEADLRREFGAQYEGSVQQAKAAMARYADPEYIRMLEETGRGNDPREIRAWIKVGREMGGQTQLKGRSQAEVSPTDLRKAIGEFDAKNAAALHDRSHPQHKWAVGERNRLFEALHPTVAA